MSVTNRNKKRGERTSPHSASNQMYSKRRKKKDESVLPL
jgi:hypothetical protein